MTMEEYELELNKFDWYYDFSDDPEIRKNGEIKHTQLFNFAKYHCNPEYRKIYNKVYSYFFSGKSFVSLIELPFGET